MTPEIGRVGDPDVHRMQRPLGQVEIDRQLAVGSSAVAGSTRTTEKTPIEDRSGARLFDGLWAELLALVDQQAFPDEGLRSCSSVR